MTRPPRDQRPGDQLSLFDARSESTTPVVEEMPLAAPFEPSSEEADPDAAARAFAADPANHVVLEASAGTGKTSVLVARYVNLLKAGVDPANILAITFTRKAAAEMRERIVHELRAAASLSTIDRSRWLELRDRLGDIAISTIDAFCLSLLREFPLEADLDPGFDLADETEVPRLIEEALDRSLRLLIHVARTDADVALVLAQLGIARTREGLAFLLDRRLVARDALDRFLARGPADLTASTVCQHAATRLQDALRAAPGGLAAFLEDGPVAHPRFQLLRRELSRLTELEHGSDAKVRGVLERVAAHFLTTEGKPRVSGAIHPYRAADYRSPDAARRHRQAVFQVAPQIERIMAAFKTDLNAVLARGIRRMFGVALAQYRRALEERSVLDFSDVLHRALELLRRMDEFAQSRFRLEARYHHVLVDEFQDTSRAQWELVALLIQSWGEGLGLAADPSIFIVGDRKQSIYRFRDAEVGVLEEAARHIQALKPGHNPRRAISRSFRSVPELLAFVNEVFAEIARAPSRPDDFTFGESDWFPVDPAPDPLRGPVLGVAAADTPESCAAAVADEIVRLLDEGTVRDRRTGVARQVRPGDIAVLFRSRTSHREFERELEARGIPSYVYKGLGFFDADETRDLIALIRFLANPLSDLRAAAFLRSRFVRLSDRGLAALAPDLAAALRPDDTAAPRDSESTMPGMAAIDELDEEDRRVLVMARGQVEGWLNLVDRVPPAELIEQILAETAYAWELRGPRRAQAWENVKKLRALVRRIQNRGYATLTRMADHIDSLTAGDESNAILEALDAVNLMTVHAAKGLEFPVVFVVNMGRGASGPPKPVRIVAADRQTPSVSIGPFVSDEDEADREQEKHETRRLLYVALTRARDRLYLSASVKDGKLTTGRGSLAEVLPVGVRELFEHAASAFAELPVIGWSSASGRTFEWRICRPQPASERPPPSNRESVSRVDLLGPASGPSQPAHQAVTTALVERGRPPISVGDQRERLLGTLLHRLMQSRVRPDQLIEPEAPITFARRLVKSDEAAAVDVDEVVRSAVDAWRSLRNRSDVSELLEGGERLDEVPFSLVERGVLLRGTIDCLVRRPDGSVAVIEFKSGRQEAWHADQLAVYVRAARLMFPGTAVEGRLIYA